MDKKEYSSLGERLKDLFEGWNVDWDRKVQLVFTGTTRDQVIASADGKFRNSYGYNRQQAYEMAEDLISCMMMKIHEGKFEQRDGRGIGSIKSFEYENTFWRYYFWSCIKDIARDKGRELQRMRREVEAGKAAAEVKGIQKEKLDWAARTRLAVELCADALLDMKSALVVRMKVNGYKSKDIGPEIGVSNATITRLLHEAWETIYDCVTRRRDEDPIDG